MFYTYPLKRYDKEFIYFDVIVSTEMYSDGINRRER